ncbi:hypothetical protein BCR44DRAFT_1427439 [Catenaria anguillulae PL171]|uniref:Uncharacterized protein n=1 Tax=Catenaria anguillulae PL171 TaxID=765915 RepID=A0A1Y2I1E0_9FUNG|nr:hypothetical protein BCR44DRAFT_1427439 [Catenaria anguillulae PL171]
MTDSAPEPQASSRRGKNRTTPADTHQEGLKLTCCGCMDIRRGVILTLWIQFAIALLAAAAFLVLVLLIGSLVDSEKDQSADAATIAAAKESLWIYFGIYLLLLAFTCAGLYTVKYRKLKAFKGFVALNVLLLFGELGLTIALQSFQVWSIAGLVLRVYWVWVFYRYIATLAMEIEHIERQEELEDELYR